MTDPDDTITDAMVAAALREAAEWWDLGSWADVRQYVRSPTDPPPGPDRDAAIAALKAADAEIEQRRAEWMRAVLRAALDAR